MWACPDDLLDVYAELRPPVAASHVYNNDDLSVSDLRIEPFDNQVQNSIDEFVAKWRKLDSEFLKKRKKREGNRGRTVGSLHLALPYGLDLWNIEGSFENTHHDRIPDEKKEEYFKKLHEIFAEIPRRSHFEKAIMGRKSVNGSSTPTRTSVSSDNSNESEFELLTASFKHYIDNVCKPMKMKKELCGLHHEVDVDGNCGDEAPQLHGKGTNEHKIAPVYHPRPRPDRTALCSKGLAGARRDEVVLRVSLHSSGLSKVKSTHTGTESQMCHEKKELEYEILGSNTLFDLKDCIYCVQDAVNGAPQVNIEQPLRQLDTEVESSYFFIEGVFYINESTEFCAKLTRDMQIWAASWENPPSDALTNENGLSNVQEGSMYYIRAAKWVIELVEKEKRLGIPEPVAKSRKRQRLSQNEMPATSETEENLLIGNAKHDHRLEMETEPKKGRPKKGSNRKPNIASRYLHPISDNNHQNSTNDMLRVEFKSMKDTKLSSLRFRVGIRYLYCHLNACEHFLYFSDVHLNSFDYSTVASEVSSAGTDFLNLYPKLLYRGPMRRRKCGVCDLWSAKCVVLDDRLTVENPTFFCQHCYHLLHYDQHGELLYDDFDVYPYLHDMV